MELAVVYFFCSLALMGGLGLILARQAVHGALSLLLSMLSLAAVYAALGAHLLAALQVIIYAGAIMILIVYIIMLLQVDSEDASRVLRKAWIWAVPGLVLFVVFFGEPLMGGVTGPEPRSEVLTEGAVVVCAAGIDCEGDCADYKDGDQDGLFDCADPDCGSTTECYGTVKALGSVLLGRFVLPFEVSSLLLLGGMVGVVLLSGRKPKQLAALAPAVEAKPADPEGPRPGGRVRR